VTVLSNTFTRERHRAVAFTEPRAAHSPSRRPAAVARLLAFAHHVQRSIDAGQFTDQADVAARFKLTRARLSQLLALTFLAPDIQEAVLSLKAVDGVEPLRERALRPVARHTRWDLQRAEWARVVATRGLGGPDAANPSP